MKSWTYYHCSEHIHLPCIVTGIHLAIGVAADILKLHFFVTQYDGHQIQSLVSPQFIFVPD